MFPLLQWEGVDRNPQSVAVGVEARRQVEVSAGNESVARSGGLLDVGEDT
jgi:hypothetical protein